jgi:PAS domain S-box-containing protein
MALGRPAGVKFGDVAKAKTPRQDSDGGDDTLEKTLAKLRASEARLRFLDTLNKQIGASSHSNDILAGTTQLIGAHMGVSICAYADMDEDQDGFTIRGDWSAPGSPSIVGHYHLKDFGALAVKNLRAGRPLVVNDNLAELSPEEAATFQSIGIAATICMPLVKDSRLKALMAIHDKAPRIWTEDELSLIREVTERSWAHIERVRSESILRDNESRYRTLFNAIDEGFCIIEFIDGPHGPLSDYVHVEANDAYALHAGIPDVVGKKVRDIVGAEADGWIELYGGVLRTGEPIRFERELEATDRWLELAAFRLEPPERKQVAVLFQDQTAKKSAEQALRASEENFRTLTRAMPNHAWTGRADGMLDWFNEQVYAYSSAEPGSLDGAAWTRIVHPDDLPYASERWAKALATGETYETEFRLRRADGAYRWHIARAVAIKNENGVVERWIGTNTEIHDQKEIAETLEQRVAERTKQLMEAEEALRQSHKMEAVGQLTGGIAHDFNNLLGAIGGSLSLIERRLRDGKPGAERYISAGQDAVRRAASLTQRLLAFSRRQTLAPKPTDANRLIAGMEDLIRRSVGPGIDIEVVGAAGLWVSRVDQSQLENALLNLCINARDSMAPNGGRLTVETANKWLDDRAARERDMHPGQYVSLCVTDTGAGMSAEVIERAFDPFFTTKPIGQGTGLGLSMVYGFVRQSGGQVRIYSELNKGTTVCLYLPRYADKLDEVYEDEIPPALERGAGETILVIDDEPTLRMLMADVLSEAGYSVLQASAGAEGLRQLERAPRIDLLITDVGLPGGLNGRQVADAARALRADLKVLFITGYAENAAVGSGHLERGMEIVTKPFVITDFAAKVRDLLDR